MTFADEAYLMARSSVLAGLDSANLIAETFSPYPTFSFGFGNIPQTFNSLFIIGLAKSASTATGYINDQINVQFNGVTSSTYNYTIMYNNGGSAASGSYTSGAAMIQMSELWTSFSSNTAGAGSFVGFIPNYSNTNYTKTLFSMTYASDGTANAGSLRLYGGTLSGTEAPVTSMRFFTTTGAQFTAGTYIGMYGM